jgi:hypothetical protein
VLRRLESKLLFSPYFAMLLDYPRPVAKTLPPITVNGVRYRVLSFGPGSSGPRYLLRNDAGELFGVYGRNARSALSAAPLELKLRVDNPFRSLDFFETESGLMVRG